MQTNQYAQSRGVEYDLDLRRHMQRIYNRMAVGVLVTAITAYVVSGSQALMALFLGGPQAFIVMLAPVAIVWFGFNPSSMSASKMRLSFFAISVLYGISFSVIALYFAGESIARAFFLAAAMFAGLSIFGYTTKKNLDGLGAFAAMGVMGVFFMSIGTMIAGMFGVETSMMEHLISGMGIIAFSGVTAWQTQAMKEMYSSGASDEMNDRMAWSAALTLYISFIALFQYILHFIGNRE